MVPVMSGVPLATLRSVGARHAGSGAPIRVRGVAELGLVLGVLPGMEGGWMQGVN